MRGLCSAQGCASTSRPGPGRSSSSSSGAPIQTLRRQRRLPSSSHLVPRRRPLGLGSWPAARTSATARHKQHQCRSPSQTARTAAVRRTCPVHSDVGTCPGRVLSLRLQPCYRAVYGGALKTLRPCTAALCIVSSALREARATGGQTVWAPRRECRSEPCIQRSMAANRFKPYKGKACLNLLAFPLYRERPDCMFRLYISHLAVWCGTTLAA